MNNQNSQDTFRIRLLHAEVTQHSIVAFTRWTKRLWNLVKCLLPNQRSLVWRSFILRYHTDGKLNDKNGRSEREDREREWMNEWMNKTTSNEGKGTSSWRNCSSITRAVLCSLCGNLKASCWFTPLSLFLGYRGILCSWKYVNVSQSKQHAHWWSLVM